MRKNWHNLVFTALIAMALLQAGCQSDNKIPEDLFEEVLEDFIDNISSPVEMAALVKSTGAPFSLELLASTSRIDDLNTNFKQALNLGVFGCDLGYLNMYEKTGLGTNNISAIKTLANELSLGDFFDFNTINSLATNNEDLDYLMYLSVSSFNKMDEYLLQSDRSNMSSLIITGMWIQGMYLATQVAKENPEERIVERIADQKLVLDELLLILEHFKEDPNFADLLKDIESIKKEYEGVNITYELGESEAEELDGMLVIVHNDKQHVDISDETLSNIIEAIEFVRNKIISL